MNSRLYRCGWCGSITNADGSLVDSEKFSRIASIIDKYGDSHTKLVDGFCCPPEEYQHNMVQVTRDMAMDAGDRSLEGQWIEW